MLLPALGAPLDMGFIAWFERWFGPWSIVGHPQRDRPKADCRDVGAPGGHIGRPTSFSQRETRLPLDIGFIARFGLSPLTGRTTGRFGRSRSAFDVSGPMWLK
jgi:hypothetical protein